MSSKRQHSGGMVDIMAMIVAFCLKMNFNREDRSIILFLVRVSSDLLQSCRNSFLSVP